MNMINCTPFLSNALKLWMGCITISLLRLKVKGRQCLVLNGITRIFYVETETVYDTGNLPREVRKHE